MEHGIAGLRHGKQTRASAQQKVGNFILQLVLSKERNELQNLLWQILAESQRVSLVNLSGATQTTQEKERTVVFHCLSIVVMDQHLATLAAKKERNEPWTKDDRRITRYLFAALEEFCAPGLDLVKTFRTLLASGRLAEKLYFAVYGITREDAERYAELACTVTAS